jgi:hypothetical protein
VSIGINILSLHGGFVHSYALPLLRLHARHNGYRGHVRGHGITSNNGSSSSGSSSISSSGVCRCCDSGEKADLIRCALHAEHRAALVVVILHGRSSR